MDYAEAGVDIDASEKAISALASEIGLDEGDYAGLLDFNNYVLGMTTDGVGTKILVAEALDNFSTIGIDCMAMNVNDLIAMNLEPVGFVDYIVLEEPDSETMREIGSGMAGAAEESGISILGGETAVMPEVVNGVDLSGSALGITEKDEVIDGSEISSGDKIIGVPSSGIHSNGLTLARKAIQREYSLIDDYIYSEVIEVTANYEVNGLCHITGGGYGNLSRLSSHRYVIDEPLDHQFIFEFIRDLGDVNMDEMYSTFNMGMGFALIAPEEMAGGIADELGGDIVGYVEKGSGIEIDGMEL